MMKKDEASGFLTSEELKEIEQVVLRAPDEDLTYAQVFEMVPGRNPQAKTDSFFIAEDDEGAAELVTTLEDAPCLTVSNNEVLYKVYKIKLKGGLAEDDIEASRIYGGGIETENIERIKRSVEERTNALAYTGDSKFNVPGILSISGSTAISGSDWGTAALDLANEVISYVNQLPRVYRKLPYTLVLGDDSYIRLTGYFNSSSAVGDRSHMERIKSAYPNLNIVNEASFNAATELYDGSTLAAGVGMLVPRTKRLARMKVFKAGYTKVENKIVDEKVNFAVAKRVGIVETPFPTAFGYITGLEG